MSSSHHHQREHGGSDEPKVFNTESMATGVTWSQHGTSVASSDYQGRLVWWDVNLSPEEARKSAGSLIVQLTGDRTSADLQVIINDKRLLERKKYENEVYKAGYDGSYYKKSREDGRRKTMLPVVCSDPEEAIELIEINLKAIKEIWNQHQEDEVIINFMKGVLLYKEDLYYLQDSDPDYMKDLQEILDGVDELRDMMLQHLGTKAAGPLDAILRQFNDILRLFNENRGLPGMGALKQKADKMFEEANSANETDQAKMNEIMEEMEKIRNEMTNIVSNTKDRSASTNAGQTADSLKKAGSEKTNSQDKLKEKKKFELKYEDEGNLLSVIFTEYQQISLTANRPENNRFLQDIILETQKIMKAVEQVKGKRDSMMEGDYMGSLRELRVQIEGLREKMIQKIEAEHIAENTIEKFEEAMRIASNSPENIQILAEMRKEARKLNKELQETIASKGTMTQEDYMQRMNAIGQQLDSLRERMIKKLKDSTVKKNKTQSSIEVQPSVCLQCNKMIYLEPVPSYCLQCNHVISWPSLPQSRTMTWTGMLASGAGEADSLESLKAKADKIKKLFRERLFAEVKGSEDIYKADLAAAFKAAKVSDSLKETKEQVEIMENIQRIFYALVVMDSMLTRIRLGVKGTEYMEQKFMPSLRGAFKKALESKSLEAVQDQMDVVANIEQQVHEFSTEGLSGGDLTKTRNMLNAQGNDLMKRIRYFSRESRSLKEEYQKPAEQYLEKIQKAFSLGEIRHFLGLMQGILDAVPKNKVPRRQWTNPFKEDGAAAYTMHFVDKEEQWYEMRIVCEENMYLERRWAEENEIKDEEPSGVGGDGRSVSLEARRSNDGNAHVQVVTGAPGLFSSASGVEEGYMKTGPKMKGTSHITRAGYVQMSEARLTSTAMKEAPRVRSEIEELKKNYPELDADTVDLIENSIRLLTRIIEGNLTDGGRINALYQTAVRELQIARVKAEKIDAERETKRNKEKIAATEDEIESLRDEKIQRVLDRRPDLDFGRHPVKADELLEEFQQVKAAEAEEGNKFYLEDIQAIRDKMAAEFEAVKAISNKASQREKNWREEQKYSAENALEFANTMMKRMEETDNSAVPQKAKIQKWTAKMQRKLEEARRIETREEHTKLEELVRDINKLQEKIYKAAEELGLYTKVEGAKSNKKDKTREESASVNFPTKIQQAAKDKKYGPPLFTWEITFLRSGPVGDSVRIAPITLKNPAGDLSDGSVQLLVQKEPQVQQQQHQMAPFRGTTYKPGNTIFRSKVDSVMLGVPADDAGSSTTGSSPGRRREQAAAKRAGHLKEYVFRFCSSIQGGIHKYYQSKRGASLAYHHILIKSTAPVWLVHTRDASDAAKSQYQKVLMSLPIEDDTEILDYEFDKTPTCGDGEPYYHDSWNNIFHQRNPGLRTKMTTEPIEHVRRSHQGSWYAASCWNGRCVIYKPGNVGRKAELDTSLGEGEDILLLRGHLGAVTHACWSPDDRFVATCSVDHTVRIWNSKTGKQLLVMLGHTGFLRAVEWSPDGRFIASGGDDACLKIWDVSRWTKSMDASQVEVVFEERKRQNPEFTDSLLSLAWHPIVDRLAVGWHGHQVEIWVLEEHGWVKERELKEKKVKETQKQWRFNPSTGKREQRDVSVTRITQDSKHIHAMQWSPTGQFLATAGGERHLRLWDARGENTSYIENVASAQIWGLEWHPDKKQLKIAVVSESGTVSVFDMGNARSTNGIRLDMGVGKFQRNVSREERKRRYDAFAGKIEAVPHPNQAQKKKWDHVDDDKEEMEFFETSNNDDEASVVPGTVENKRETEQAGENDEIRDEDDEYQEKDEYPEEDEYQEDDKNETSDEEQGYAGYQQPKDTRNKPAIDKDSEMVVQKKKDEAPKKFLKDFLPLVYMPVMSSVSGPVYDVGDIMYVQFPTEEDFSRQNPAHLQKTLSLNIAKIGARGLARMKMLAQKHSIAVRSLLGEFLRWSKPKRIGVFDDNGDEYFFTGNFAQDQDGITYLLAFNEEKNTYCEFAYNVHGGLLGERSGGKLENARWGGQKRPVIHRGKFTDRTFVPSKLLYPPPVEQQFQYPMSPGQADGFGPENTIFVKGITYVRFKVIKEHVENGYRSLWFARSMEIKTWDAQARYGDWKVTHHGYDGLRLFGHSDINLEGYLDSESGFMAIDDMKRQYILFRDSGFKEGEFAEIVCQDSKIVGFRMPDAQAFSAVNYEYVSDIGESLDGRVMKMVYLDYWNGYPLTQDESTEDDRDRYIEKLHEEYKKKIDKTNWEEKDAEQKLRQDELNRQVRQRIEEYERRKMEAPLTRDEKQSLHPFSGRGGGGGYGGGRGGGSRGRGIGGGSRGRRGGRGNTYGQGSVSF